VLSKRACREGGCFWGVCSLGGVGGLGFVVCSVGPGGVREGVRQDLPGNQMSTNDKSLAEWEHKVRRRGHSQKKSETERKELREQRLREYSFQLRQRSVT